MDPAAVKFLATFLCALGASVVSLQAAPPNILLIVSEDNGPELGCYGDPYARTPNLDRLASEGVRFNRAFVPQAGCSQSRASFLTGLYPHQHGQIGLATWGFRLYRKDTGKSLQWGYPDYFFGREPAAPTATPTSNKRKKKNP